MKLGVLDADKFLATWQQPYQNYAVMFQQLFDQINAPFDYRRYAVLDDELPQDLDECDAYLVTGSKFSCYQQDSWVLALQRLVQQLHQRQKKLIGICFGHQLIAHALGGKAERFSGGWGVGIYHSKLVQHPKWLTPNAEGFNLIVSHQDQVSQLPPGAKQLASNDFCHNAAFTLDEHILCFQGHPEFTPDYAKQLLAMRKDSIEPKVWQAGMQSLAQGTHQGDLIARWIINFLSETSSV